MDANLDCELARPRSSRGIFRFTALENSQSSFHLRTSCFECTPKVIEDHYKNSTNESATSAPALFAMRMAWRSTFFIKPSR